jgi:hypothetical protein
MCMIVQNLPKIGRNPPELLRARHPRARRTAYDRCLHRGPAVTPCVDHRHLPTQMRRQALATIEAVLPFTPAQMRMNQELWAAVSDRRLFYLFASR